MEQQSTTLAEALLRRKELQQLLSRLEPIKAEGLFTTRVRRVNVAEGIDEVTAQVPVVTDDMIDQRHNQLARKLRLIDAAIQQANWTTQLTVPASVFSDPVIKTVEDAHKDVVR